MEFHGYDKFYSEFDKAVEVPADAKYCVTEKVHGSNFAIYFTKDG